MIDEKKLEEGLVALEAAKSWSPRVVSRLEMLMRSGTDEELYRINPIQFATAKSIVEAEAIDLFLHACVAGLFDMDWMLVCPVCSDVVESFRSLRKMHAFPLQPLPKRLRCRARRLHYGHVHRFARRARHPLS
jgi:hypothetical protein